MTIPRIEGFDISAWVRENSAGTVWRARQHSLDRPVHLLVVQDDGDPARAESLRAAARLVARINLPGLVGVHDIARTPDGIDYIVLDAFEGQSLRDLLAAEGPFPEGRLVSIAHSIADILSKAWASHRFVHRNLKPEELFLLADGSIRITGFTSGTCVGDDGLLADRSGEVVGTPSYMPPEQAAVKLTVDMRADMYALGAILYHLATGHAPFEEYLANPMRLLGILDFAGLPPPHDLNPALSPGFETVLARLLMKDPQDRYNSWGGLLQDLDSLAVGQPPAIAPAFVPQGKATFEPPPLPPSKPAAPARRVVTPPTPRPANDGEAPEVGVMERVRQRERAASNSPVPTILYLVLIVALGALGYWRWNHPDVKPTLASLLAHANDADAAAPSANKAADQDDAVTPLAPLPAAPEAVSSSEPPPQLVNNTGLPLYAFDYDFFDDADISVPSAIPPSPPPSVTPPPPPPRSVAVPASEPSPAPSALPAPPAQTPSPTATPSADDLFARKVLGAIRQTAPDALREALHEWNATHPDEALAAVTTLNACGWPFDRLGERLTSHRNAPVRITQGEKTVILVPETYMGGRLRGRLVPGKDGGEERPVEFSLSSLDRSVRWSLYQDCAPTGVSTEPERHAATALYALAAGDVAAFRAEIDLAGGLTPVLQRIDDLIRSHQP